MIEDIATLFVNAAIQSRETRSRTNQPATRLVRSRWRSAPMMVVAIFFLVFAHQLGTDFYRNRPGRYRPDAIPASVLPQV